MINLDLLNGLFKPIHNTDNKNNFRKFIIDRVGKRKYWKIKIERECSKSINESCINTNCQFNFLNIHQNELYIDVLKEIQQERKELEDK